MNLADVTATINALASVEGVHQVRREIVARISIEMRTEVRWAVINKIPLEWTIEGSGPTVEGRYRICIAKVVA